MQNRPAPAKVGRGAQLKGPTPFVTTDARPPPVGRAVNMQKGVIYLYAVMKDTGYAYAMEKFSATCVPCT
jgi:hypothetical protein